MLRSIRLWAIADAPTGHSVSLDQAMSLDDAHWASRAGAAQTAARRVWVAERDGGPVGIVGGHADGQKVVVDALWVAPQQRGRWIDSHVAEALLDQVRDCAHGTSTRAALWVHEHHE